MNFACEKCNMPFLKSDKLVLHLQDYHGIAPTYNCTKCNFAGPSKKSIRLHMKEHITVLGN